MTLGFIATSVVAVMFARTYLRVVGADKAYQESIAAWRSLVTEQHAWSMYKCFRRWLHRKPVCTRRLPMLRTGYSVGDLVTAEQLSNWQQSKMALHRLSTQVTQVSLAPPLCERFKHTCTAQRMLRSLGALSPIEWHINSMPTH